MLGLLIYLSTTAVQGPTPHIGDHAGPQPNWRADFPERIERVTAALTQLPLALPNPSSAPQGAGPLRWVHRRYEATVPKPKGASELEQLFAPISAAAPGVTLHFNEDADGSGARVQVGVDDLLTHTVALHWLTHRPQVAIVIDDLGNDLLVPRSLVGINAPLALAVTPARPFSKEVAELAALFGREVLLDSATETDTGADKNVLGATPTKAGHHPSTWLTAGLASLPHVVGVAGQQAPTTDPEGTRVLDQLKAKGLFLVDRSGASETACRSAAAVGVRCIVPSLVLEIGDNEEAARSQLEKLVKLATAHGSVLAVGHASQDTVAAIQAALPAFAEAGVDVVPVATLVGDPSLSPH